MCERDSAPLPAETPSDLPAREGRLAAERETAGAEGASGSPDYGLTTKAGVGFTLRLLILQLPASD